MTDWSRIARETIGKVHSTLPDDITFKDRAAAIFAAYPFGPREMWPYKAWCTAQRGYLKRYDPETPAPPLLPAADLIAKARPHRYHNTGRATRRERVCQTLLYTVVAVPL